LRDTIREHFARVEKIGGPPIRFVVSTPQKKHFYVEISRITKDGDLLVGYDLAYNSFATGEDPRFRATLDDHEALDLDTGRTQAFSPWRPENWPDAFELVHDKGRPICKKDTQVIELEGVKSFAEAAEQAFIRFDELAEEERFRGDLRVLDKPDVGSSGASYFALITNRGHLAVVELTPPKDEGGKAGIASIHWSLADVGSRAPGMPPVLVT